MLSLLGLLLLGHAWAIERQERRAGLSLPLSRVVLVCLSLLLLGHGRTPWWRRQGRDSIVALIVAVVDHDGKR